MTRVLEIKNLTKEYGKVTALNQASFSVDAGSVFGILGPNGSGKTTTLGIILDVLGATSGTYSWFGNAPSQDDRKRIGAILEQPNFYPYLSAVANLKIVCEIKEVPYENIDRVLKLVNLYDRRASDFKTFSLGMKQRLAIGAALLNDPEVLVLDEPTNGLDPQGIAEVRQLIKDIAAQGKTILLASHMLDEVEKVCTHVALLKFGQLLVSGPVREVMSDDTFIEVRAADMNQLYNTLQKHPQVATVTPDPGEVVVTFKDNTDAAQLNKWLHEQGVVVSYLSSRKQSLESFFLEMTNQSA